MGGIVCAIHRNAVLRFSAVPIGVSNLKAFDKQIRNLMNVTTIAEAIAEDAVRARKVCETLAKTSWSSEDRRFLHDTVERLYE